MKYKDELLDELADEYCLEVDYFLAEMRKLASAYTVDVDDMRRMSELAHDLAVFAEEQAAEMERVMEH